MSMSRTLGEAILPGDKCIYTPGSLAAELDVSVRSVRAKIDKTMGPGQGSLFDAQPVRIQGRWFRVVLLTSGALLIETEHPELWRINRET